MPPGVLAGGRSRRRMPLAEWPPASSIPRSLRPDRDPGFDMLCITCRLVGRAIWARSVTGATPRMPVHVPVFVKVSGLSGSSGRPSAAFFRRYSQYAKD